MVITKGKSINSKSSSLLLSSTGEGSPNLDTQFKLKKKKAYGKHQSDLPFSKIKTKAQKGEGPAQVTQVGQRIELCYKLSL
jgi:hypothetical protein